MDLNSSVKLLSETSGILFFLKKDDVENAFRRAKAIIESKQNSDSKKKLDNLSEARNLILENFDDYKENNYNLISQINEEDKKIIFYGNKKDLKKYKKRRINEIKNKYTDKKVEIGRAHV